MKIKHLAIISGVVLLTSCVVSKKKYTSLENENDKLKKEILDSKNNTIDMSNEVSKISYSLGVNVASSIKTQGMETIDTSAIAKAFGDVFSER